MHRFLVEGKFREALAIPSAQFTQSSVLDPTFCGA
jgi:hypothetical protein